MTLSGFIAAAILAVGFFFLTAAAAGALRFPDFYTRSHALGVTDTVGTSFILAGVAVHHGISVESAKLVILIVFIYISNPTVTHVLARAALRKGLKPWSRPNG
mgnify:CR=1 FL=1